MKYIEDGLKMYSRYGKEWASTRGQNRHIDFYNNNQEAVTAHYQRNVQLKRLWQRVSIPGLLNYIKASHV